MAPSYSMQNHQFDLLVLHRGERPSTCLGSHLHSCPLGSNFEPYSDICSLAHLLQGSVPARSCARIVVPRSWTQSPAVESGRSHAFATPAWTIEMPPATEPKPVGAAGVVADGRGVKD